MASKKCLPSALGDGHQLALAAAKVLQHLRFSKRAYDFLRKGLLAPINRLESRINAQANPYLCAMGSKKLIKMNAFNASPICINGDLEIQGNWHAHFGNRNPIVVELGCGTGDMAVGLARLHPDINYVGVDIQGLRMWTGVQAATQASLSNVAFLRCDLHEVHRFFATDEVSGIWIAFPDPHPKLSRTKNRVTNERFLQYYTQFLPAGGTVWLKTDHVSFFAYTRAHFAELNERGVFEIHIVEETDDLHASELKNADNGITTDYERRFMEIGKSTRYMQFTLAAGRNIGLVPATARVTLDYRERAPRGW